MFFVQTREKFDAGCIKFCVKYSKIMHFSNFLKTFFENSPAPWGSAPGPPISVPPNQNPSSPQADIRMFLIKVESLRWEEYHVTPGTQKPCKQIQPVVNWILLKKFKLQWLCVFGANYVAYASFAMKTLSNALDGNQLIQCNSNLNEHLSLRCQK